MLPFQQKKNQEISLNRVEDTIRYRCHILLPDIKNPSCQYFLCEFALSWAIPSNHCQTK